MSLFQVCFFTLFWREPDSSFTVTPSKHPQTPFYSSAAPKRVAPPPHYVLPDAHLGWDRDYDTSQYVNPWSEDYKIPRIEFSLP